jgi:hypothetical protein
VGGLAVGTTDPIALRGRRVRSAASRTLSASRCPPEELNTDPYGAWMIELEVDGNLDAALGRLLDAAAYKKCRGVQGPRRPPALRSHL